MDDVAREYLLITLALGKLEDGFVDAYFGPPEVREEALAAHSTPLELAQRAATLRDGLGELDDAQRARWLDRQLLAVETIARRLGGQQLPYLEEVERCFDAAAERTPAAAYEQVRRELDELLPGDGDLRDRLAARDDDLTVPVEALPGIVEWLAGELRASAERLFDVPAGERLSVTLVADKPWAAYNWYRGNLESLIEINTDLPTRATQLVPVLAHETFPGHHLEHISKEQRLVIERGYHESSVQLINTPESYVSEGLGEAGVALVAAQARWQELLIEICARAGIPMSVADAERNWRIVRALHRLRGSGGDAALMLHVDGRSEQEVVAFLEDAALRTHEQAVHSLQFLGHPLWRTYIFCYAGGERLLNRWLDAAADENDRIARFGRLLSEQLTPSGIVEELTKVH